MAAQDTTGHPVIATTRARQGRWGRHALWVLIVSFILAALALAATWGMRAGDLARVEGNQRANTPAEAAQGTTAPAPARQVDAQ